MAEDTSGIEFSGEEIETTNTGGSKGNTPQKTGGNGSGNGGEQGEGEGKGDEGEG